MGNMTALAIALLIAGVVLLVAEAHLPTAGALGATGVAALVAGIVWMGIATGLGLVVVLPVAAGVGLAAGGLVLVATRKGAQATHQRVRSGSESLVGRVGVLRSPPAPTGQVMVDGALWRARPAWDGEVDGPLERGDRVIVEKVDGLTLCVRRAEEWEETS